MTMLLAHCIVSQDNYVEECLYLDVQILILITSFGNINPPKKQFHAKPFVTVWMDMENIMPSEISQSEKDKSPMISFICAI